MEVFEGMHDEAVAVVGEKGKGETSHFRRNLQNENGHKNFII